MCFLVHAVFQISLGLGVVVPVVLVSATTVLTYIVHVLVVLLLTRTFGIHGLSQGFGFRLCKVDLHSALSARRGSTTLMFATPPTKRPTVVKDGFRV